MARKKKIEVEGDLTEVAFDKVEIDMDEVEEVSTAPKDFEPDPNALTPEEALAILGESVVEQGQPIVMDTAAETTVIEPKTVPAKAGKKKGEDNG